MILLDTDTVSLLMRDHRDLVRRIPRDEVVAITIVTRIEILQGRFASILKAADSDGLRRAQYWLAENERFMNSLVCITFNEHTLSNFERLRIEKRLKNIGRADLLIACIALAQQAKLITRNTRHFQHVPGLQIENWAD